MSETISDVHASSLLRYLERAKWHHVGSLPGLASVWASPTDENIQVAVPDDRSIADYEERVGDALRILGDYEHRSPLNLLEDVLGTFRDWFRFECWGQTPLLAGFRYGMDSSPLQR